jgi:hypothetical protein
MNWLLNQFADLWQALGSPQEVNTVDRVKWTLIVLAILLVLMVPIGQLLISRKVYYPAERFRLALAWSLLAYAFALAALLGLGWYFNGNSSLSSLSVHISLVVASLASALFLMPSNPKAIRLGRT